MAILKKIYPIIVLPMLAACEEVFTPDMPYTPVLCVNSLITSGEPIEAAVSRSRLYTDTSTNSKVKDANVKIYANDKLQLDSYIPKEGDEIKIVVTSPSYGTAEAKVSVPIPIATPKAKLRASDIHDFGNNDLYKFKFKLDVELTIEDSHCENYYKFSYFTSSEANYDENNEIFVAEKDILSIQGLNYNLEPIFSEHIGILESAMGGDADGFTYFTDRQFNGKTYTLQLHFDNCEYMFQKWKIPDCKLHFIINSISPSYYNMVSYIWQRENGALTDFNDVGFGDPIWGYSNVTTGAGVVAAQSSSECAIDLTDLILEMIDKSTE